LKSIEFIKPAPIFDTGSSLFHNSVIINAETVRSKPFSKNFEEQIKSVKNGVFAIYETV